jgi:hypothetical protein
MGAFGLFISHCYSRGGFMIVFSRTAGVEPGMFSAALAFANEIKALIKEINGVEVQVAIQIGGNPNRIAWMSSYESLAAFDAAGLKLLGNPKYQEMLKKTAGMIVPETIVDEIWRVI